MATGPDPLLTQKPGTFPMPGTIREFKFHE